MKCINKIFKKHLLFLLALLLFTSTFTLIGNTKSVSASDNNSYLFFDSITFDKKSPQALGSTINITANATGSDLNYEFWLNYGKGPVMMQNSKSSTFTWKPVVPGFYKVAVYIRDSNNSTVQRSSLYRISVPTAYADDTSDTIAIKDENLKNALLSEMGKSSDETISKSDMESIKTLDLSNKNISSIDGLNYCTNLEELQLASNNISDISPLADMKNLWHLVLWGNNIDDISPLSKLQKLSDLSLAFNPIDKIDNLAGLSNLKYLDVSYCNLNDVDTFTTSSKSESLDTLDLSENNISDIKSLSKFPNLKSLTLNNNKISDISFLTTVENLQQIRLQDNQISDISPVSNLKKLWGVYANNQNIQLSNTDDSPVVKVENPIKNINGNPLAPCNNISNNGAYDANSNTISWKNTDGNNTTVSYNFNEVLDFGNKNGNFIFSGTVSKNITNTVNIPDSKLRAAILQTLGKSDNYSITKKDMQTITNFRAANQNISSLEGLQYCTNLETLTLTHNNISDISCLKNLTKLKWLDVGNNNITDIKPLSSITSLTTLSAYNNKISDISSLSKLVNLTSLYLYSNIYNTNNNYKISNIESIKNLTKLTTLSLAYQNITDISALKNLTNLEALYLNSNKITNISSLSNLTNLKDLALGDNSINDISPLKSLTKLESLSLNNNNITDISTVSNLTKLTTLILANNKISNLSPLANLTNLKRLELFGCKITDISPLAKLTNLETLKLSDQVVSLPEEKFTDVVTFKNPITFLNGSPVSTLSKIDPNGTYNPSTNSLTWTSLNRDTTVEFSFSTNFTIGKAFTNFSGRVSKNMIHCN